MFQYVSARMQCFFSGKKGQGMVEYALILAFVVVLAIALTGENGISARIQAVFDNVGDTLGGGAAPAPTPTPPPAS